MTSYFDIETCALPDSEIERVKPVFSAPSNYRRPEAIAANVADQEAVWKERAALDATTGRVLCIGMLQGNIFEVLEGDEPAMLVRFWRWLEIHNLAIGHTVVGFSIFHFDLGFLARRSWVQGITIPSIAKRGNRWQPWNENFIDIAAQWQCGNRDQTVSLDILAKSLGIGAKNGSGKDFAATYATDRAKALAYLENDLQLTRRCYERMNGLELPELKPITTQLANVGELSGAERKP